jgi:capsular exopolysaccharide synthesis family protein
MNVKDLLLTTILLLLTAILVPIVVDIYLILFQKIVDNELLLSQLSVWKIILGTAIVIVLIWLGRQVIIVAKNKRGNTIKNPEDVEQKLGLPLLTALPKLKIGKTDFKREAAKRFLKAPGSAFAESIRTACTGIMLSNLDTPHKVLIVTSSIPNEGKTTFAINQAFALGHLGKTLLIEADMRHPTIAFLLNFRYSTPGLFELVSGYNLEDYIHSVAEAENLDIIVSGRVPPNPLELLLSSRFKELLGQIHQEYEYIVIDSPPTITVSDVLVLAKYATDVLYVVKANSTPYQVVQEGLKRLRQVEAPVHNIILNQLDSHRYLKYRGYEKHKKPKNGNYNVI